MAKYRIQGPDGGTYDITAPDDASEQDVVGFAQQQFADRRKAAVRLAHQHQEETRRQADVIGDMSGPERFAAGAGKAVFDTGRGIGQLLGLVSEEDIKDARKLDEPLTDTGAGTAGDITGNVAMTLLPGGAVKGAGVAAKAAGATEAAAALSKAGGHLLAPKTITGAAAQGAAMGAVQPAASSEERVGNTLLGTAGGAAVPVVVRAGSTAKAALEPLYEGGREKIVGRVLRRVAGQDADQVVQRLENAAELVPGSRPTAAQVAQSGGVAALERTAAAINPTSYTDRWLEQNAAHVGALQKIAGTDAELAAAEGARKKATSPLYAQAADSTAEVNPSRVIGLLDRIVKANPKRDALTGPLGKVKESLYEDFPLQARGQEAWKALDDMLTAGPKLGKGDTAMLGEVRTVMDRVKKGAIDQEAALGQLKGLSGINDVAIGALEDARRYLKMPERRLSSDPQALMSASKNLDDLIQTKGPNGRPVNEAVVRELTVIKKALDGAISRAEPSYGLARDLYRELSAPVNRMEVGRTILEKGTSALASAAGNPKVYGESMAQAMRGDEATVRAATGFARNKGIASVMRPDQMSTLQAITGDLSRMAAARDLGRGAGSDTVQKLAQQNILDASGVPLLVQKFAPLAIAGNVASRAGDALYNPANRAIEMKLAEALLEPKNAAAMMKKGVPSAMAKKLEELATRGGASAGLALPGVVNGQQ